MGLYYALSGKFLTYVSRGNEKVMPINASRSEINMGSASTLLQQVLWQFNGCCSILLCDAKKPKPCGTVPELVLQISVQCSGYLPSLPCTNHLLATVLANLYYVSGVVNFGKWRKAGIFSRSIVLCTLCTRPVQSTMEASGCKYILYSISNISSKLHH